MTAKGPYSRLYHSIVDDPMFESVFNDDAAFATWLRLLVVADSTYPATAPIPRGTRSKPLQKLIDAGLIELQPVERYRVRGLDAERERRSQSASVSALLRWNTPRREGGHVASRGTRFKVLQRDNFTCRYCGRKAPDVVLDVDHVVPVRDGGKDDLSNLVAACLDCNTGKSGHALRAQGNADARASESEMPRRDETSKEETSKVNGDAPASATSFIRYKPKPSLHDGSHPNCLVCVPLQATPSSEKGTP